MSFTAADSGWNSNEGAGSEWNDTTTSNGGVSFGGIEPEQVSKHDQPGADATCRRCQQPGHFVSMIELALSIGKPLTIFIRPAIAPRVVMRLVVSPASATTVVKLGKSFFI